MYCTFAPHRKQGLDEDLYRCQFSLSGIYQRNGKLSKALRLMEEAGACAVKMKDRGAERDAMLQKVVVSTAGISGLGSPRRVFE